MRFTVSRLHGPAAAFAFSAALACLASGCGREPAPDAGSTPTETAPPPRPVPENDPTTATVERAAPPTLDSVAEGRFAAGNPVAETATGDLDIEDTRIEGANGASFLTERVALVTGDDQYSAGARYADAMMIEPREQVELRRVIEETPPSKDAAAAFCGAKKTGYLAIAHMQQGGDAVVKVAAFSGQNLPAASAGDTALCASTQYVARAKK